MSRPFEIGTCRETVERPSAFRERWCDQDTARQRRRCIISDAAPTPDRGHSALEAAAHELAVGLAALGVRLGLLVLPLGRAVLHLLLLWRECLLLAARFGAHRRHRRDRKENGGQSGCNNASHHRTLHRIKRRSSDGSDTRPPASTLSDGRVRGFAPPPT